MMSAQLTKRLLEERGAYRLYEVVTVGRRSLYVVETANESWQFNLLYQARSKFDRLSERIQKGGLA